MAILSFDCLKAAAFCLAFFSFGQAMPGAPATTLTARDETISTPRRPEISTVTALVSSTFDVQAAFTSFAAQQSVNDASLAGRISSDEAVILSQSAKIATLEAVTASQSSPVLSVVPVASTIATWDTKDPVFELNNDTFQDALIAYTHWTRQHREEIISSYRGEHGEYLYQNFGNNQLQCGVEEPVCGCGDVNGVGLLDHIHRHVPNKTRASEVYFTISAIDLAFKQKCAVISTTREASLGTSLLNEQFAESFFPQLNPGAVQRCKAREALIDSLVSIGIFMAMAATTEIGGTLWMETSFDGVLAWLIPGEGLTNLDLEASRLAKLGQKLGPEWQQVMDAVKDSRRQFLPTGRGKKVLDNLVKFGITNSASKFAADYNGRLFTNWFAEDSRCGINVVKDNRLKNMGEMNSYIADQLKGWPGLISGAMQYVMNGTGTGENGTYEDDQPSLLAVNLLGWFADADEFREAQSRLVNAAILVERLRTRMTNTLIQKEWADQQCSLQCGPNPVPGMCEYRNRQNKFVNSTERPEFWCPPNDTDTICQAVCWQGSIDSGSVPLYGIERLSDEAWDVNITDVYRASWQAYKSNATASYTMVRHSSLLRWKNGDVVHDGQVPLLPVTLSQYTKIQDVRPHGDHKIQAGRWTACNVGDRWGNQSQAFWRAGRWNTSEHKTFLASRCRDNINKILHPRDRHPNKHPGIFYVNQCRVLAHVAYPESDKNFKRPFRVDGDRERALQTIKFVDTTVPKLRELGKSEDEIEIEITKEICKKGSPYRRVPKNDEQIHSEDDANDDDEGYGMTLDRTKHGCGKWRKSHKWA